MKHLLTILVLLAGFTAVAHEEVKESDLIYGAGIDKTYSEHEFMDDVDNGGVKVNLSDETITLTLYHKMPECPVGFSCIQLMPIPTIITLPIVNKFVDRCNSIIYIAVIDNTPVDGLKEQITVTDNTENICPTFIALSATSVQYSTYNPWVNKTTYSSFEGSQLRLLPTYFQ